MKTIILKKEFIKNNGGEQFEYRRVYEDNNCYAYAVKRARGKASWYEVFKRKVQPLLTVKDGKFHKSSDELKEQFPNDNAFGRWAFHCTEYEGDKEWCCMKHINEWAIEAQKG